MFGINLLSQKVAELEEELYWAKCMIYDLQNPYTLEIGQKVDVFDKRNDLELNLKDAKYKGVVVNMKHNYHKKAPYFVSKYRVNYYSIYDEATKETNELTDDVYIFKIKN